MSLAMSVSGEDEELLLQREEEIRRVREEENIREREEDERRLYKLER